jgi:hypothetical protein
MGIDGSDIVDHWLEQSPQPHIGPESALGICLKDARGVIRDWINRNMRSNGSPYMDKGRLRAFLKNCLLKKPGKLLSMNINQPRIMTGLLAGYCHFTGH